jgi:ABC-type uncharacterized transport system permease subunit
MDRILLVISTFCFIFAFAATMYLLGARVYRPSRLNFFTILTGFAFQSGFLYLRGQQIGRCPLTNLFEVLVFLSWATVLFYLVVGPTYRLSLLGAFTAPVAMFLQIAALLAPGIDVAPSVRLPPNPWMELHAAISVVAYGAFALAGIAGVMYLAQERQLKTHHIHSIFYHLPPIRDLGVANSRLMLTGFTLLTVGLFAGFMIGNLQTHLVKIVWSVGVWLLYGFIIVAGKRHQISGRRVALLSVGAFTIVLLTLSGISFITERPQL